MTDSGYQQVLAYLSGQIEAAAVVVAKILTTILPFLPDTLVDKPESILIVVGFAGQGLFAMRFIIQWLSSEKQAKSVIPVAFWYFSIGGGLVLFLYAIWRQDLVFMSGQGLGLFIYLRNLYFVRRSSRMNEDG
ncbi:MAG: lipid-A-disaccharide synthase N-terminal domain-containing protein [Alphaproteobacteria bacterium]